MSAKKIIIGLLIASAVGGGIYLYKKKHPTTKTGYINAIIANSNSYVINPDAKNIMKSYNEDYLKAWYLALEAGEPAFAVDGIMYRTQGGTKVMFR